MLLCATPDLCVSVVNCFYVKEHHRDTENTEVHREIQCKV